MEVDRLLEVFRVDWQDKSDKDSMRCRSSVETKSPVFTRPNFPCTAKCYGQGGQLLLNKTTSKGRSEHKVTGHWLL